MRLHPSERCLELAVLRAGGAVRACAYRLGLPELPPPAVPAAACSKGSPAAAGAGAAGAGVGAAGAAMGRDRWFFCCYLSNGVGIDLLPTTPEEVSGVPAGWFMCALLWAYSASHLILHMQYNMNAGGLCAGLALKARRRPIPSVFFGFLLLLLLIIDCCRCVHKSKER